MGHREVLDEFLSCRSLINQNAPPGFEIVLDHYLALLDEQSKSRSIGLGTDSRRPGQTGECTAPISNILKTIVVAVSTLQDWVIVQTTPSLVRCIPRALLEVLPPIGRKQNTDLRGWFSIHFEIFRDESRIGRFWRSSQVNENDLPQRNSILTALTSRCDAGVKYGAGTLERALAGNTPAFSGQTIFRWGDPTEVDLVRLREIVVRDLSDLNRSASACATTVLELRSNQK